MALIKNFQTPHGVTAQYHKLIKVELDAATSSMTFVLAIFSTSEARESGCAPLWHEYVRIPIDAFVVDPRAGFYDVLKRFKMSFLYQADSDGGSHPTLMGLSLTDEAESAHYPSAGADRPTPTDFVSAAPQLIEAQAEAFVAGANPPDAAAAAPPG